MGFDQRGSVVIKVQRAQNGKWDVNEIGFDKPLASFDSESLALTYANDIVVSKPGSRVESGETDKQGFTDDVLLDSAIEMTFPSSDPISISPGATRIEGKPDTVDAGEDHQNSNTIERSDK